MEFKEYFLDEICVKITDGAHLSPKSVEKGYKMFSVKDMMYDNFSEDKVKYISEEDFKKLKLSGCMPEKEDILIAKDGSYLKNVFLAKNHIDYVVLSSIAILRPDKSKVMPDYLSYYLRNPQIKMQLKNGFVSGSVLPRIVLKDFKKFRIKIPSLKEQNKIINILLSIDSKIHSNIKIINNLDQISHLLFKRWFIDFEFPNEDGKPYKSSGGEMVESELGEIPKGWSTGIIKDYYENFDSKRKPLSKLERSKREKIYRYYGAASLMDFVDDYIFDGIYLLMGEDGTVKTEEGMPVLQYVYGKFWVNNHAHVMQGKNGFTTEYLYLLLKRTNITNIITGAVQPKISQGNLNKIKVIKPTDDILEEFNKLIKVFFEEIRNLNDEVKNLEILRDTLLPKLLSGEIEIPEDLEV